METGINVSDLIGVIDYRVAVTRDELEQSYRLVYNEYLKRNYTAKNDSGMRFSIFNALPQTTTFVAESNNSVLATATLIEDSPLGLPMDEIYHDEVDKLRQGGKKICEISMLASNTALFGSGISMMLNSKKMFFIFHLFKCVFDYALTQANVDYFCITINPKHNLTYDFLLFKNMGELKAYNHANGAPALAKYLDLKLILSQSHSLASSGLYRMFFLKKTPLEKFANKFSFTSEDLKYFFAEKSDILRRAPSQHLEFLKNCYPACNFSEILG